MHRSPENQTARPFRYVVYGLVDPRDGRVRYIGATKNLRQRLTLHRALDGGGSGATRRAWLEELRESGRWPFGVVVLQEVSAEEDLREAERAWIRRGNEFGWALTNTLGISVASPEPHIQGRTERRKARIALRLEQAGLASAGPEAA